MASFVFMAQIGATWRARPEAGGARKVARVASSARVACSVACSEAGGRRRDIPRPEARVFLLPGKRVKKSTMVQINGMHVCCNIAFAFYTLAIRRFEAGCARDIPRPKPRPEARSGYNHVPLVLKIFRVIGINRKPLKPNARAIPLITIAELNR